MRISACESALVLVFGCRKKKWSLRGAEVAVASRPPPTRAGESAKVTAELLSDRPLTPTQQSTALPDREPAPRSASGATL